MEKIQENMCFDVFICTNILVYACFLYFLHIVLTFTPITS